MIYNFQDIRALEVELTTKCNAACPMCPRNDHGGATAANLPDAELSLAKFKSIVEPEFLRQLEQIYFCGTYGDPQMARDTIPIIEWIKGSSPSTRIGMSTNGGARSTNWWRRLAHILTGDDWVTFAIDGIGTTNAVYRQKVKWGRVVANAKSFIEAGGTAHWEFIVFRHNQDEVEDAREFASRMGFKKFVFKKTYRFLDKHHSLLPQFPVKNEDGKTVRFLQMPSKQEYLNPRMLPIAEQIEKDPQRYLDRASVRCLVQEQRLLHLTAEGLVFPCGWLYDRLYGVHSDSPSSKQLIELLTQCGGKDAINALNRPIREIVHGEFFAAAAASWHISTVQQGKLERCAIQCGPLAPARAQRTASSENVFPIRNLG